MTPDRPITKTLSYTIASSTSTAVLGSFPVPKAGLYAGYVYLNFQNSPSGYRVGEIKKSGGGIGAAVKVLPTQGYTLLMVPFISYFNINDAITVCACQNSGTTLSISGYLTYCFLSS